ncbi:hypothetical protein [Paludisphaera mucosa]|uniref:UBC core domain-containing protein n=1 Tax=Paludisphaera mucosa TaxID=3030827 RepID=A0ABT6FLD3_9BACT|nr:hypothetical protein [Paludisphaera mucosa]MDG3008388.1 hypothetical protein [Paludisphaera mucosa]
MPPSVVERHRRWGVEELLANNPDLRIVPSPDASLKVRGELHFHVRGPGDVIIGDAYQIDLLIPPSFPATAPAVFENGGRIPKTYHKLEDGSLCLAAPTELRLRTGPDTTIGAFVETFVVPYLFGYSYREKHGVSPYGELEHGRDGLRQHFASLFGVPDRMAAQELVRLASLKKRPANKVPCPCGSRRRLGRCHHTIVNELRAKLGRAWFASQYDLPSPIDSRPANRIAERHQPDGVKRRKGKSR